MTLFPPPGLADANETRLVERGCKLLSTLAIEIEQIIY